MEAEAKIPHWIPCPNCNELTDIKTYSDTVLINFPLYCPHCNKESIINVINQKLVVSK